MFTSQGLAVIAFLATASVVKGHGYVVTWTANGEVEQGQNPGSSGGYSGIGRPTDNGDWGPNDHDGPTSACGGVSSGSGLSHWALEAGVQITAGWSGPDVFDTPRGEEVPTADRGNWPGEHTGPILEYMARCPGTSCDGVDANSLDWFKIGQATWDGVEWPTSEVSRSRQWTFGIPSDIAPGPYLVRHELIGMQQTPENGGLQSYPYCIQVQLSGSGTAAPTETTTFPEAYSAEQYPWRDYSWPWDGRSAEDYVPPGPAVYGGGAGPATGNGESSPSVSTDSSSPTSPTSTSDDNDEAPEPFASSSEEGPVSSTSPAVSTEDNAHATSTNDIEQSADQTATSPVEAESSSTPTSSGGRSRSGSRTRYRCKIGTSSHTDPVGGQKTTTAAADPTSEPEDVTEVTDTEDDTEGEVEEYERRDVVNRYASRFFLAT